MSTHTPTDAEKAMAANADSRAQQGADSDKALRKADRLRRAANPPPSRDLTGPAGDPAEGKR